VYVSHERSDGPLLRVGCGKRGENKIAPVLWGEGDLGNGVWTAGEPPHQLLPVFLSRSRLANVSGVFAFLSALKSKRWTERCIGILDDAAWFLQAFCRVIGWV
jgi:hypothetical protein